MFIQSLINKFHLEKPTIKILVATGDDKAATNLYAPIHKMLSISDGRAICGDKIVVLLDKQEASKNLSLKLSSEKV